MQWWYNWNGRNERRSSRLSNRIKKTGGVFRSTQYFKSDSGNPIGEIRKTAAIFRFLLPNVWIRTAGGRIQLQDGGANLFAGGINGAITGDMLTTSGSMIEQDKQRIQELGYEE